MFHAGIAGATRFVAGRQVAETAHIQVTRLDAVSARQFLARKSRLALGTLPARQAESGRTKRAGAGIRPRRGRGMPGCRRRNGACGNSGRSCGGLRGNGDGISQICLEIAVQGIGDRRPCRDRLERAVSGRAADGTGSVMVCLRILDRAITLTLGQKDIRGMGFLVDGIWCFRR